MNYKEYGKQNSHVMILLHGGGLSWWNYEEVAEILQKKFRIILPILDGHAGSDSEFTSIEENASRMIEYIDQEHSGKVFLIGGLSLGGQIATEILAQRQDICNYAVIESALVFPMQFTYYMIKPAFTMSFGLIKKKWFSKLQFKSLRIKPSLFDRYYEDTCKIQKSDMISFLKANAGYVVKPEIENTEVKVKILVGSKEAAKMKKSAKQLHRVIPGSSLEVLEGLYHGELSIKYGYRYVSMICQLIKEDEDIEGDEVIWKK